MSKPVIVVSSLDTKWQEVKFLKEQIENQGEKVLLLDMSMRSQSPLKADISCEEVAMAGGMNISEVRSSKGNRDEYVSRMVQGAIVKVAEIFSKKGIRGIVAIGGVTNTVMGTDIMKSLPFGVPKLMVSSGAAMPRYAGQFFGASDILMFSSVVDMVGLHALSKSVMLRAAGAICGMAKASSDPVVESLKKSNKPLIALTQFHYCEICCEVIREHLEKRGYIVIPCHADGVGDRAMDKLIEEAIFDGVIDIGPGGVSEQIFGGNRAGGQRRLEAAAKMGLPQVIAPCGFDMISCGPLSRKDCNDPLWISRNIANRKYYVHDAYRVQARINAEELRIIAKAVADKLNQAKGPVKFLIPTKGWSSISSEGQPLYDPETDRILAIELRKNLKPEIEVREVDLALNTPEFALLVVDVFTSMVLSKK